MSPVRVSHVASSSQRFGELSDDRAPTLRALARLHVAQLLRRRKLPHAEPLGVQVGHLLPETDRVVLIRNPERPEGFVPWSTVCEVMGREMQEVPDLYPKRFRVRKFPTTKQLSDMEPSESP